jgi:hypothetical protein
MSTMRIDVAKESSFARPLDGNPWFLRRALELAEQHYCDLLEIYDDGELVLARKVNADEVLRDS